MPTCPLKATTTPLEKKRPILRHSIQKPRGQVKYAHGHTGHLVQKFPNLHSSLTKSQLQKGFFYERVYSFISFMKGV